MLFRHSEISDFNCKIQLSVNSLFNEPVIHESSRATSAINTFSIVLEGMYNKHDGHTAYTFRQLEDNTLSLNSTAVRSVSIHGIELSTVNEKAAADGKQTFSDQTDEGRVTTRFALTGQMAMQELEDFDMLSYDTISFSSLYIDMTFDIDAPQHSKQFQFNPRAILLDPGGSILRKDSLAAHFPITLQSLEAVFPEAAATNSVFRVCSSWSPSPSGWKNSPTNQNTPCCLPT